MHVSNRTLITVVALVLLCALVIGGIVWLTRPQGPNVQVSVNGEILGTYPLHKDQTIVIAPDSGRWHNILQIKDGRAAVIESDCENQICVNTPALCEDFIGIIVCLPHGVVVELSD